MFAWRRFWIVVDIPLYFAELPLLLDMVNLLVELQRLWSDRVEELLALGLPDWRAPALGAAIAEVVERAHDEVSAEDRATLAHFVRGPPGRFDDVAACTVRDTWSTATSTTRAIFAAMGGL